MDDFARYFEDKGVMHVVRPPRQESTREQQHEFINMFPEELRDYLIKILDPTKRKKAIGEAYKTSVFVASYWMIAIFLVLLFLPDSRFFAPFIGGYIGGRKAGTTWKGLLAAMIPFFILGVIDVLVFYNLIYHFYDLYIPTAGILGQNLLNVLTEFGMETGGMDGSFYDPGTTLSKYCIYMMVAAIIGGAMEDIDREREGKIAHMMTVSNLSDPYTKRPERKKK